MNSFDSSDILAILNKTPESIITSIATKVKERRLEKNLTQQQLASKAGMPLATYRRFEREGEVSLRGLTKVAIALEMEDDFNALFVTRRYQSMDELLGSNKQKQRKRAYNNG